MTNIYISGENVTSNVKYDGFNIEQVLGSAQDACSITFISGDKPIEGQEIIIENGIDRIFAGIITNPKENEKSNNIVFYNIEAVDYTYQLDKKLVVEVYENTSASDIILDILSKYCTDFTSVGVILGAPNIEYIKFDYIRPSDAFEQISEYVGWNWYVDYYKDIKFFEHYNAYAPVTIDSTTPIKKLAHNYNIQGLRNRVYVLGGKFLSDFQTFEYIGNGVQRIWVLGHEPYSPSVMISEVPKTIGLENVDDEAEFDYMYNQKEKFIRCSNQTSTPVNGATVSFTYKYPMPVITMVEDIASQQAVSLIQGGDGVYEHKIVDDSLITIEAAEAAGQADLALHANPIVKGSFETEYIKKSGIDIDILEVTQSDFSNGTLVRLISTTEGLKLEDGISGQRRITYDISAVKEAINSKVSWDVTVSEGIIFKIYTNLSLDGGYTWQGDIQVQNGDPAPGLVDTDLSNARLRITQVFIGYTAILHRFSLNIFTKFETWKPGQLLNISLPERGIDGQYVIQKVNISTNQEILTYKINYGGRLKGIPDLLKTLVSNQQQKKLQDVEYQTKIEIREEYVGILDELIIATRTDSWICGDIDAICGEIVCLGGGL